MDEPTVRLMLGDCLDRMAEVADGSVDLVACDLPYGTTACRWDVVIPLEPLWAHYRRVLRPRGAVLLHAVQPFASAAVMSNPGWFKYEWVWDKSRATGHLNSRKQPLRVTESILVYYGEQCTYNPQYRDREPGNIVRTVAVYRSDTDRTYGKGKPTRGYYEGRVIPIEKGYPLNLIRIKAMTPSSGAKVHPTQKPVALMEYLVRTYTDPGATVLDNAMGSGTTGVACRRTGRHFIGIERDADYFATAERRIAAALRPESRLDPRPPEAPAAGQMVLFD